MHICLYMPLKVKSHFLESLGHVEEGLLAFLNELLNNIIYKVLHCKHFNCQVLCDKLETLLLTISQ